MGPKSFTACYVCLKEFGSKSIAFHEPACLKRWRNSNRHLPADKRSSTPVKSADKNQNNPSWVCSHFAPDDRTTVVCAKRKSSSPKRARSLKCKLVKSSDECSKSSGRTQLVQSNSGKCELARSDDVCSKSSSQQKEQGQSDSTKCRLVGSDCCVKSNSQNSKLVKSDCCDGCLKSGSQKQRVHLNCSKCKLAKSDRGNDILKSSSPKSEDRLNHVHHNSKGIIDNKLHKSGVPKQTPPTSFIMTGVAKPDFSPKKGKENKNNNSNQIPPPSVARRNAKNNEAKQPEEPPGGSPEISSTSRRSVRPQTKILRRPTPNLNHPVIQVDSDDSSCSDKSNKDDNPKRLRMGEEDEGSSTPQKPPKDFIAFNKSNVDRKAKSTPSIRGSAVALQSAIPNPCNSCSRSLAPERLHSHAKKDSRGLMYSKSPPLDVKMASPQKKPDDPTKPPSKLPKPKQPPSTPDNNKDHKPKDTTTPVKSDVSSDSSEELINNTSSSSEVVRKSSEVCSDSSEDEERDVVDSLKACYVCQEDVKDSDLLLHESKCLESWKKSNNALTPQRRQLPPRRPDDAAVPLSPCPVCGRTFFPERLPVHRRVCKGRTPLKRTSSLREEQASHPAAEESPRPVYVPCYVCGRNYGSWVIAMHEQQCIRRWRAENQKLPDEEKQQEPTKPDRQEDEDVASLIELGDNAWESHLQQLVPCPLCTRTFFPDRLGVHQRSCKGPVGRRPKSNKGA